MEQQMDLGGKYCVLLTYIPTCKKRVVASFGGSHGDSSPPPPPYHVACNHPEKIVADGGSEGYRGVRACDQGSVACRLLRRLETHTRRSSPGIVTTGSVRHKSSHTIVVGSV